jgi:chemotaxis protein methyltransferase CheR
MTLAAEIADVVRRETGIVLPASRDLAIMAAVRRAAPGLDPAAFMRAVSGPQGDRALVHRLVDEVTIQETSFVRDRAQFDEIAWHELLQAALASGSQVIRVWSAGCASGEEAYTLALLAAEAFAPAPPAVNVLGTDVSSAAVTAATAGRYRERAVRGLGPALRQRYLDRQADDSYVVVRRVRELVRFRRHNLVTDPIPPSGESHFDLVVCRNVLIYFDAPTVARVIEGLERSLRPGGVLLLGAADALRRSGSEPVPERGPPPARRPARPPRQPSPGQPPPTRAERLAAAPTRAERLAAALDAAGNGDRDGALAQVGSLLGENALDADAHFVHGLVALGDGRPVEAAESFRRALFADPDFGLAAFNLGRAYDELGDSPAARRSYQLALRTLNPADDRHRQLLQQVDIADMTAACRVRLSRIGGARSPVATGWDPGSSPPDVNNVL